MGGWAVVRQAGRQVTSRKGTRTTLVVHREATGRVEHEREVESLVGRRERGGPPHLVDAADRGKVDGPVAQAFGAIEVMAPLRACALPRHHVVSPSEASDGPVARKGQARPGRHVRACPLRLEMAHVCARATRKVVLVGGHVYVHVCVHIHVHVHVHVHAPCPMYMSEEVVGRRRVLRRRTGERGGGGNVVAARGRHPFCPTVRSLSV